MREIAPALSAAAPRAEKRLIQLDLLRGVAILLVLFRHPVLLPAEAGFLAPLARAIHCFGWTGVDLFFVLSGFLIGGLLFHEYQQRGAVDVRRFLVRRGLKIYPAYIVFIAAMALESIHHDHVSIRAAVAPFVPNLFHIQNYFPSPAGQTWSLAVEEHFYLALALLVGYLVLRRRMSAIPWVAAALIVTCTGLRFLNLRRPFDLFTHAFPTQVRADGLFFGVLLAYLHRLRPRVLAPFLKRPALLLGAGLALVVPMAFIDQENPFVWTIGFTMLYVGYGCILLAVVSIPLGKGFAGRLIAGRASKCLAFIGFYSYSIYLWHALLGIGPVSKWLHHGGLMWLPPSARWFAAMGCYVALAALTGALMASIVERPVLAVREWLFPRRSTAIEPAAESRRPVLPLIALPTVTPVGA